MYTRDKDNIQKLQMKAVDTSKKMPTICFTLDRESRVAFLIF